MKESSGIILAPFGALYSAVMRARSALYKKGVLKVHRAGAPVISVGNITTGGTGKTPIVEWVARQIAEEGRRVCILTRGYGRLDAKKRVVVSDGERILADASLGGDEPRLLAEKLRGVAAVISDADRVAAASYALENLKTEVFVLDDGFQHQRLARDLDLLAVDATNPWGGGQLLPRGRLREPLRELARADCIILTRSEQLDDLDSLRRQAERLSNASCPIILSRTPTKKVRPLAEMMTSSEMPTPTTHPFPSPVAAFCAIGNPRAFFEHVRRDGNVLSYTQAFSDHHIYTQEDIDRLVSQAKQAGAEVLITTEKDAVKLLELRFDFPCYVLEIELEFDDEEKLATMIHEAIRR